MISVNSNEERTPRMKGQSHAFLLLLFFGAGLSAQPRSSARPDPPTLVEKVSLDWDHSGTSTAFALSSQHRSDGAGDADRLVIQRKGNKPWILLNKDDEWAPLKEEISPKLLRKNLIQSARMLFFKAGSQPDARIYLILKGGGDGCCAGSLTVLTPGEGGAPIMVFHASEHLLAELVPEPIGQGMALVGPRSDAEAVAQKNAASYDPYRVYIIKGPEVARYDVERSKSFNLEHYCGWAGPDYDEKFVAVNIDPGQYGAGHCRAMTHAQFDAYRAKHPAQFP